MSHDDSNFDAVNCADWCRKKIRDQQAPTNLEEAPPFAALAQETVYYESTTIGKSLDDLHNVLDSCELIHDGSDTSYSTFHSVCSHTEDHGIQEADTDCQDVRVETILLSSSYGDNVSPSNSNKDGGKDGDYVAPIQTNRDREGQWMQQEKRNFESSHSMISALSSSCMFSSTYTTLPEVESNINTLSLEETTRLTNGGLDVSDGKHGRSSVEKMFPAPPVVTPPHTSTTQPNPEGGALTNPKVGVSNSPLKCRQLSWKKGRPKIHSFAFNQDRNSIAIGTNVGYRVRTIPPFTHSENDTALPCEIDTANQVTQVHDVPTKSIVTCCRMLHSSCLVALVLSNSPRSLHLQNAQINQDVCTLYFTAAVRRVEMNRSRAAQKAADGKLYVIDLATLKVLKTISIINPQQEQLVRLMSQDEGFSNFPQRYFDLSIYANEGDCWLACKASTTSDVAAGKTDSDASSSDAIGTVNLWDLAPKDGSVRLVSKVKAHCHPIECIALGGPKGRQCMATASQKVSVLFSSCCLGSEECRVRTHLDDICDFFPCEMLLETGYFDPYLPTTSVRENTCML